MKATPNNIIPFPRKVVNDNRTPIINEQILMILSWLESIFLKKDSNRTNENFKLQEVSNKKLSYGSRIKIELNEGNSIYFYNLDYNISMQILDKLTISKKRLASIIFISQEGGEIRVTHTSETNNTLVLDLDNFLNS